MKTNVATILLVIFVTLKLCKLISWSWLWVLSPLWISLLIALFLALLILIIDAFS